MAASNQPTDHHFAGMGVPHDQDVAWFQVPVDYILTP